MKIQLIDRDRGLVREWRKQFRDCDGVVAHYGDIFDLDTDCIVSPCNSFGFMDRGINLMIFVRLGERIEDILQKKIQDKYNGKLLVGQAELIKTYNKKIPYVMSAPTMRVPMILENTVNCYLASRAIFSLL